MELANQAGPSTALAPAAADVIDWKSHPSGIIPTLQNVVATVNLGCKLDLKAIALNARNAEYNPKRFAAVIMRIREPKTTALIFASGKMVCTGAKSEADSRLAAKKYARIIQKLGFDQATFKDFKIQNIVGSCDVKFPIRLEGLAVSHGYFATYEPELFPGLIYRMKQPKIVLLIFVSGKVVLTGAKKRDEIYQAFEQIYATLTEFRKPGVGQAALSGLPGAPALPGTGPTPLLPGAAAAVPAGGGMGPPAPRVMGPPAPRAGSSAAAGSLPLMPPPSPAHPSSSQLPPASPMHPSQMPAETPAHHPAPSPWVPPATPAHPGPDNATSWQPGGGPSGSGPVQFKAPAVPAPRR